MIYNSSEDVYISSALKKGHLWDGHAIHGLIKAIFVCKSNDRSHSYLELGTNIGGLFVPISKAFIDEEDTFFVGLEAAVGNSALLKANVMLNGLKNTYIYAPRAISDKDGESYPIHITKGNYGQSHIGYGWDGNIYPQHIKSITLDQLLIE